MIESTNRAKCVQTQCDIRHIVSSDHCESETEPSDRKLWIWTLVAIDEHWNDRKVSSRRFECHLNWRSKWSEQSRVHRKDSPIDIQFAFASHETRTWTIGCLLVARGWCPKRFDSNAFHWLRSTTAIECWWTTEKFGTCWADTAECAGVSTADNGWDSGETVHDLSSG